MRFLVIFIPIFGGIYYFFGDQIISQLYDSGNEISQDIVSENQNISSQQEINISDQNKQNQEEIHNNNTQDVATLLQDYYNQKELQNQEGTSQEYIDSISPVKNFEISSFFGPRLQASKNYRYDFHRGLDYHHDDNVEIFSIAKGEIYKTYLESDPNNPYKNSGTTVIIKHTLEKPYIFHDQEVQYIYSLYTHLSEISDKFYNKIGSQVKKGDIIGNMGKSGTTEYQHLHFEIRAATTCSHEYQIKNPDSHCATILPNHADPHVNPLIFLPNLEEKNQYSWNVEKIETGIKIFFSTQNRSTLLNKIIITEGAKQKIIDFNLRDSIDLENIDNNNFDGVTILPEEFSTRSKNYQISFEIDDFDLDANIQFFDIWGNQMH